MAGLEPGRVLGERFEIAGVLGQGGTATVYLATDRLREQRVALKVLHPHLVSDPAMRARLRREVEAAGLLRHPGALVAWDLHEMDGHLALSMPFHRGHTLAEHVAAQGPLTPEAVRQLGVRIAGALAHAHRQGVLHRDVSPTNVLVDEGGEAVLTDFGLARVGEGSGTRSTGLLGTAGYAAPEVYSGHRRDPRSDLYGLGAVLYLAATGRAPFEAPTPMGVLQLQLDDTWTPLAQARPDLAGNVASTIDALLRADPRGRPPGAREVADALELGRAARLTPAPKAAIQVQPVLAPGRWTVIVKEKVDDRGRREALRVELRRAAPSAESEIRRWAGRVLSNLRDAVGLEAGPTPEDLLAMAVAEEAGLPRDALGVPPGMTAQRFRLVEDVDRDTAHRLAHAARDAGFRAQAVDAEDPADAMGMLGSRLGGALVGLGVLAFLVVEGIPLVALVLGVAILVLAIVAVLRQQQARLAHPELPAAFGRDLGLWLTDSYRSTGSAVPAPTRGQELLARAHRALGALETTIDAHRDELPDPAIRDLRATVADLRVAADALGADVDRVEAALDGHGAETADASWMQGRLDRLRTMERAGEAVDPKEIGRLTRALEAQRRADAAAEALESQLTSSLAQLLEIASTAARVRRELLAEPEPARSADRLVEKLRSETRAAAAARREADRRQRDARTRERG